MQAAPAGMRIPGCEVVATLRKTAQRVLRTVFFIVSILSGLATGYIAGEGAGEARQVYAAIGAAFGALLSGVIMSVEMSLRHLPASVTIGGGVGLGLGVVLSGMITLSINHLLPPSSRIVYVVMLTAFLIFPYLGLIVGVRYGEAGDRRDRPLTGLHSAEEEPPTLKLLDTSVIIDGRIADLCETGFIEGIVIIPQFILQELQYIADSSDSLIRTRGRRGLDVLHQIQKNHDVEVQIIADDFPHVKEIDSKLVELAKKLNAKILTNDLNLNKVAALQGVRVLNINELSNALKPVVLPGETMRVFVLKEGKEAGQGVAYLDDGTMVVVDHAKRCIGKNVDGIVTSVLQTSAGRMIFARLKEPAHQDALSFAHG